VFVSPEWVARNNDPSAEETYDARRDRQPIRPRTRGISRWHQKSEYETRRKLHDVIIVLWECLEWSEYHNTGVAHYGNYCYRFYSLLLCASCPAVNSHVAFTCPREKPNFFVCSILSGHRAHFLHGRRVSAPLRRHYRCTFFEPRKLCDLFQTLNNL